MRIVFALVAGLLSACGTEPGDINTIGATIFGTVSRDGVPVAAVMVRSTLLEEQCQGVFEPFGSTPASTTDSAGRYRKIVLVGLVPPGPFCVGVRAVFDRDGVTDSVTISGVPITMSRFAAANQPRDSFRVDIALPP